MRILHLTNPSEAARACAIPNATEVLIIKAGDIYYEFVKRGQSGTDLYIDTRFNGKRTAAAEASAVFDGWPDPEQEVLLRRL